MRAKLLKSCNVLQSGRSENFTKVSALIYVYVGIIFSMADGVLIYLILI